MGHILNFHKWNRVNEQAGNVGNKLKVNNDGILPTAFSTIAGFNSALFKGIIPPSADNTYFEFFGTTHLATVAKMSCHPPSFQRACDGYDSAAASAEVPKGVKTKAEIAAAVAKTAPQSMATEYISLSTKAGGQKKNKQNQLVPWGRPGKTLADDMVDAIAAYMKITA